MKAVIMAGGRGTRLMEETGARPKPMVEIGGRPILWHIMKGYEAHGITDFVICAGHLGHMIKEYFAHYRLREGDMTIGLRSGEVTYHRSECEDWTVTILDTGAEAGTGRRLARARRWLEGEDFCLTYGDGVGDVDVTGSVAAHKASGALVTMTVVTPPSRFGAPQIDEGGAVVGFAEKPRDEGGAINAGFFVVSPEALDWIDDAENCMWEEKPLPALSADGRVRAWRHDGFWHPMDTLRDRVHLEGLWQSGAAPWRVWPAEGQ